VKKGPNKTRKAVKEKKEKKKKKRETRNSGARLKAQYNKISRQRVPDNRRLNIYNILLVLTRRRYLSCSANAVSAKNSKFLPTLF